MVSAVARPNVTDTDRVVVVGAGVAGLAAAHALVPDHDVVVLDRGTVGGGATSRASGMISLALEPLPPAVRDHAWSFFHDFDGTGVFDFFEQPTVRLVPAGDGGHAEATAAESEAVRFHTPEDLHELHPGTFDDLSGYDGALEYLDHTGFLDPEDYGATLRHEADVAGARIYRDRTVTGLRIEDDEVTGVETDLGPVDADYVVVATGWRTREFLADHVELPVRPMRWNALVVDPGREVPPTEPMGSDPERRVYWRPTRHGDLLVGGNEHLVDDPESATMRVDESFVDLVQSDLADVLAGADGEIRRTDCCPGADTASPDGLPIVDAPAETPDGLVVATGFHGRGVMLSPVTGAAVRAHVADEDPGFALDRFALDRFTHRSPDFDYVSHWD